MRGVRLGLGVTVVLVCALVVATTAGAADSLYWSNFGSNSLSRASLTGGGGENFISGGSTVEEPVGSVIDAAMGKIYWIDYSASRIGVANLDGSEAASLNTPGVTVSRPSGLAIDPTVGRIYWVELETPGLFYAELDGGGAGEIPTPSASFDEPLGVAVDPSLGKAFWANRGDSTIDYAKLDGTGGAPLSIVPEVPQTPEGVAIDGLSGKIYWANAASSSIGFANVDGSGSGKLATTAPIEGPDGIAVDPLAGKIYWANSELNSLASVPLSGIGGGELDVSGANPDEPKFPILLRKPMARPTSAVVGTAEVGATLSCPTGRNFEPDLVESFLFRAPDRETISWALNGVALNGATSPTLVATQPGSYACLVTGTNGAGSTTAVARTISVTGTASNATPISVRLRPVSRLQILKLKYDKGNGTATLLAKVSGPGRLYLYGKNLVRRSVRSSGAGIAKVKVEARGGALKSLRARGEAKLKVRLRFVTSEGGVARKSRSVTLHLRG